MASKEAPLLKTIRGTRYVYVRWRDEIRNDEDTGSAPAREYRRTTPVGAPVDLCVELTTRCNIECLNCFSRSGPGRSYKDAELDLVHRHIDNARRELVRVCVTGGEPLLHPGIMTVLRWPVKYQDLGFVLNTNGTVRRDLDPLLAEHAWTVAISLHGARDAHEGYTRSRTFDEVVRRVRNISKTNIVHIYCALHDGIRSSDVEWLFKLRQETGCAILRFIAPRAHGRHVGVARTELIEEVRARLDDNTVLKTTASQSFLLSTGGRLVRTH